MTRRASPTDHRHGRWLASLTVALLAMPASTPALGAQARTTFHAEARLVVVHATVQDHNGQTIEQLDRSAFRVYENGRVQPIAIFLRDDVPVSLGLVLDNSGSMSGRRSIVEAAALAFVHASNPLDEAFVINFGDLARVDVPLTSDVTALVKGIARLDSIGGTALRDAIELASTYLARHARRDRKALLVITDGRDNASAVSGRALKHEVDHSGVAVYAVGLPNADPAKTAHAHRELDDLAEHTGGLVWYVASLEDLQPTTLRLAHLIRQQYTLGYTPQNQALDGTYRTIRVEVKAPGAVSVRTRAGYYATPVGASTTERR